MDGMIGVKSMVHGGNNDKRSKRQTNYLDVVCYPVRIVVRMRDGWKCRRGGGRGEVPQWHEAVHVVGDAHREALFCVIHDITEGR